MCGGKGSDKTTSTSSTAPPDWLNSQLQNAAGQAATVSSTPYSAYSGQRVAPISDQSQQTVQNLYNMQGLGQPFIDQASQAAARGTAPITTADIMQGYSPFIDQQVAALQGDFNHQNAREMQRTNSQSTLTGALTGDRAGIARGLTEESQRRTQDPQIEALRAGAFGQAANLAQGNQQAALQGASTFGMLGQTNQNMGLQGAQAALSGQDYLRQYQQAVNDWNYQNNYLNPLTYPYQNSQFLTSSLGALGPLAGSSSEGTTMQPKPSLFSQIAGTAAQGVGAYLGASDERIKENVVEIGRDNSGMPIYRYNFSGDDPRNVQMGYIAQEVAQRDPSAVSDMGGGLLGVDYDRATTPAAAAAALTRADPAYAAIQDAVLAGDKFMGTITPQQFDTQSSLNSQEDRAWRRQGQGVPDLKRFDFMPDAQGNPLAPSGAGGMQQQPLQIHSRAGGGAVSPMMAPNANVDPDFARMNANLGHAVDSIKGRMDAYNGGVGYAGGGGIGGLGSIGGMGALQAAGGPMSGIALLQQMMSPQHSEAPKADDTQKQATMSRGLEGLNSVVDSLRGIGGVGGHYAGGGGVVAPVGFKPPSVELTQVNPTISLPMPSGGGGLAKASLPSAQQQQQDSGAGDWGKIGSAVGKYLGTPSENAATSLAGYSGWGATTTNALGQQIATGGRVGYADGGAPDDDQQMNLGAPSIALTDVAPSIPMVGVAGQQAMGQGFAGPSYSLTGDEQTELNPTGGVGLAPSPTSPSAPSVYAAPASSEPQYATDEAGWVPGKEWYEPGSNPDLGAAIAYGGAQAMQGNSPYPLQNIGRGIASGLEMRMSQIAAERQQRMKERAAVQEAERLAHAAAFERLKFEEDQRHNKVVEGNAETTPLMSNLKAAGLAPGSEEYKKAMLDAVERQKRAGIDLTPAQKAVDQTFAKDYVPFVSGGYATVTKNLVQIREVLNDLDKKNLTGFWVGHRPDALNKLINPDVIDARNKVAQGVQDNLRIILGSQFTEKEGENILNRAYDPTLDESYNKKRLGRLVEAMEKARDAKMEAGKYFEEHGTLTGFPGIADITKADLDTAMEGAGEAKDEQLERAKKEHPEAKRAGNGDLIAPDPTRPGKWLRLSETAEKP